MKYTTYSRYLPELADTVNLQALLDQLADFLLQSGFAGGAYSHPFWGEFGEDEADRSLDALRQAILQALMESGQLTPEMLKLLRGESTGDAERDAELQRHPDERAAARRARRADQPRVRRSDGAPGRIPLILGDRADARLLALDDPVRGGPLYTSEEGGARAHAPDPHAVPGGHAARGAVP